MAFELIAANSGKLYSLAAYHIIALRLTSNYIQWHHWRMRTTLSLQDDAVQEIRTYAKRRKVSMGKAASELIHRGARYQLGTRRVNGLLVFDVPDDFPIITSERVREILDQE